MHVCMYLYVQMVSNNLIEHTGMSQRIMYGCFSPVSNPWVWFTIKFMNEGKKTGGVCIILLLNYGLISESLLRKKKKWYRLYIWALVERWKLPWRVESKLAKVCNRTTCSVELSGMFLLNEWHKGFVFMSDIVRYLQKKTIFCVV